MDKIKNKLKIELKITERDKILIVVIVIIGILFGWSSYIYSPMIKTEDDAKLSRSGKEMTLSKMILNVKEIPELEEYVKSADGNIRSEYDKISSPLTINQLERVILDKITPYSTIDNMKYEGFELFNIDTLIERSEDESLDYPLKDLAKKYAEEFKVYVEKEESEIPTTSSLNKKGITALAKSKEDKVSEEKEGDLITKDTNVDKDNKQDTDKKEEEFVLKQSTILRSSVEYNLSGISNSGYIQIIKGLSDVDRSISILSSDFNTKNKTATVKIALYAVDKPEVYLEFINNNTLTPDNYLKDVEGVINGEEVDSDTQVACSLKDARALDWSEFSYSLSTDKTGWLNSEGKAASPFDVYISLIDVGFYLKGYYVNESSPNKWLSDNVEISKNNEELKSLFEEVSLSVNCYKESLLNISDKGGE